MEIKVDSRCVALMEGNEDLSNIPGKRHDRRSSIPPVTLLRCVRLELAREPLSRVQPLRQRERFQVAVLLRFLTTSFNESISDV